MCVCGILNGACMEARGQLVGTSPLPPPCESPTLTWVLRHGQVPLHPEEESLVLVAGTQSTLPPA